MKFEAREIESYADPVLAHELQKGNIYFMLNFIDNKMLVPQMNTIVFIGKNLQKDDSDACYFQDISSYEDGVRYENAGEDSYAEFYQCPTDGLSGIYDFEKALEILMYCSMRRRGLAK